MTPRQRNPESGFALLLVYAMAAAVAIMLYMQLPRVAFEAQREKEQLLIDRGQQYSRAVQLYVRKYQRFPTDIAALENTQNIRFLRKQYTDPMTGKNEWRIIHVGPGGVFTDSQVYSNQAKKEKEVAASQTSVMELQGLGGSVAPTEGVNLATRRRPGDLPVNPADPNNPAYNPAVPPAPGAPPDPNAPLTAAAVPGQPMQGGMPPGFQMQPNQFGQTPLSGGQMNAPPQSAANLINQILTTPRPMPGLPSQGGIAGGFAQQPNTGTATQGGVTTQTIGGGMAGVASKYEQEGIKLYNDRSSYNQWEFVYDMSKDPTRANGQTVGQTAGGTGTAAPSTAAPAGAGTIPH